MPTDSDKIQALEIFMMDANTVTLTKEELVIGIKTILEKKTISPKTKLLLDSVEKQINEKRGNND